MAILNVFQQSWNRIPSVRYPNLSAIFQVLIHKGMLITAILKLFDLTEILFHPFIWIIVNFYRKIP